MKTLPERINYIPTTISQDSQRYLKSLYEMKIYEQISPAPNDGEAWRKRREEVELEWKDVNDAAINKNNVVIKQLKLGSVSVLDIRPNNPNDNKKVMVYIHGGGFTIFSARSTLILSAPICRTTGLRVISIDFTTAPFADWQQIQQEIVSVFQALLDDGYTMQDIAIYGDSAGGGLAMNTVINLRDNKIGMPAAVVLLSPWADLTNHDDTSNTLEATDPILRYDSMLKHSAMAYADGLSLDDPRISPIYADFTKGFPPTLIIEGTKCVFLSMCVRLYRLLENAKQVVKLDLYEGMWHVFQRHETPEAEEALKNAASFIKKYL